MNFLRQFLNSPDKARAIPYILFVLPIYLGGKFGLESFYWVYLGRTLLGAARLYNLSLIAPMMSPAFT